MPRAASKTKARLLVVEDEAVVAIDVRGHLERLGYEVVAVTDTGEEACRLAAELEPDLILMDV
ncbi:MAG: response regulator, partial [Thermoanaerobaculia bacterium]